MRANRETGRTIGSDVLTAATGLVVSIALALGSPVLADDTQRLEDEARSQGRR